MFIVFLDSTDLIIIWEKVTIFFKQCVSIINYYDFFSSYLSSAKLILLPPIKAAEIVECVSEYVDGISQNLQSLSPC